MGDLVMTVTVTAEAEVTKAADIRQWTLGGVFEDDEVTVEVGRGAVYVRTGGKDGISYMARPETARDLSRVLNDAAAKAEPKKEQDER